MSTVTSFVLLLEDQLRASGKKGTHRVMRTLKKLRRALEEHGYSFVAENPEEKIE